MESPSRIRAARSRCRPPGSRSRASGAIARDPRRGIRSSPASPLSVCVVCSCAPLQVRRKSSIEDFQRAFWLYGAFRVRVGLLSHLARLLQPALTAGALLTLSRRRELVRLAEKVLCLGLVFEDPF